MRFGGCSNSGIHWRSLVSHILVVVVFRLFTYDLWCHTRFGVRNSSDLHSRQLCMVVFLTYKVKVENQLNKKIKRIKSKRGNEYVMFNV